MKIKNKLKANFFPIFFTVFFITTISSCQKDGSVFDSPATDLRPDTLTAAGHALPDSSSVHSDSTSNSGNSSPVVSDPVSSGTAPAAASETVNPPANSAPETGTSENTGSKDASGSYTVVTNPTVPVTSTPSVPVQSAPTTPTSTTVPAQPAPVTTTPPTPIVTTPTTPAAPTVSGHNIQDDLPKGYVKDGTVDYTSNIQSAINKYKEVVFPGFPVLINDKGLKIPSDRTITFLNGSVIKLKPTSVGSYKILNLSNVSNVTLVNPVIIGDRKNHLGTTGEDGRGIAMIGSSNIKIINPNVSYTWGDGIYISGNAANIPCKNIVIDKAYISKAGRNGISVISAENLTISDPYVEYSDRLNPMAGIDIEPNGTTDELKNIRVVNPVTYKNGWTGIQIGMSQFYYDNVNPKKQISIEVDNHKDEGSVLNGVWLSTAGKNTNKDMGTVVSGTLKFINPHWKNNQLAIKGATLKESAITFTLDKPIITDLKGLLLTAEQMKGLFSKNIGAVTKNIIY